ncbi:Arc family DNA-binding protein [Azotobacter beijerinckii]|uniref:Arc-like DNA binding domain-containing protein n=1 Tax=Azotobacter beijerinckii TaxID=170623 RepID=A0A1I0Z3X8_9GAMM|nr:Arc family DNA-binding protein [Azotobacter beijerinckii]SFB18973.1 Arc-like DNA binding domain-containing protein [Azotobacter beijerinckii]
MKDAHKVAPFSLRLREEVRETAEQEAKKYRRSLNAEIGLLIEEGFKWREMQSKQAVA